MSDNLFEQYLPWFHGQLKKCAGVPVIYWRPSAQNGGNGDILLPVQALLGRTYISAISSTTGPGADPRRGPRDFRILATDLVWNGAPLTPAYKDGILEEIPRGSGIKYLYNLDSPPKGGPVFEYDNDYRPEVMLLVHTKFAGVTSSPQLYHTIDAYAVAAH